MKLSFSAFVLSVLLGSRSLPNTYVHSLSATDNATCGAHPDPHFYTWDGMSYDYQGACDIILVNNTILQLQLRTKAMPGYSTTSDVALEVYGVGKLEIDDVTGIVYNTLPAGDVTTTSSAYSIDYEYTPGPGQFIRVSVWAYGAGVQIQANGATFAGSEGMCGSWDDGGINKRDGTPFPTFPMNTTAWAYEWQVDPSESLFSSISNICTPGDACSSEFPDGNFPCRGDIPATGEKGRKLKLLLPGEVEKCEKSCNDIDQKYPELIKNCNFDVIVTGKTFWACNPSYTNPVFIRPDNCPDVPEDPTDPPETEPRPSKWERFVAYIKRILRWLAFWN